MINGDAGYTEQEAPKSVVGLTPEQQAELAAAATQAMANLNAMAGPIIAAFQQMAQQALPAFGKAFEPVSALLKEWGMTAGELEATVKGEALAYTMKDGYDCRLCSPPRRVAKDRSSEHNFICHSEG